MSAYNSVQETHKANQLLWLAMIVGVIMIAIILSLLTYGKPEFFEISNFASLSAVIGTSLTLVTMFLPDSLIKKRIADAEAQSLSAKFDDFRSNFVLKVAMHEAPALICTIFMFVESNVYFIFLVCFNILMMYTAKPTIEKFKQWYSLTSAENSELDALML